MAFSQEFLGSGIVTPMRRIGASDFVNATGVEVVRSAIRQIAGTVCGEIRWHQRFGTRVDRLRHKPNNEGVEDQIQDELTSAIQTFEPRISNLSVQITRYKNLTTANITWSLIDKNASGNQTLIGPDSFEVKI